MKATVLRLLLLSVTASVADAQTGKCNSLACTDPLTKIVDAGQTKYCTCQCKYQNGSTCPVDYELALTGCSCEEIPPPEPVVEEVEVETPAFEGTSPVTEGNHLDISWEDEFKGNNTYLLSFIKESESHISQFAPEMVLLLAVSIACFFMTLTTINGRMSRIDQYVHNYDFEITEYKEKADRGAFYLYLTTISYYYMFLPFVVVIYWGLLLIYDSWQDSKDAATAEAVVCDTDDAICESDKLIMAKHVAKQYIGGLSVLLIGLSTLLLILAVSKIRWNNWRFKSNHLTMLIISYILFTLWQYIALLSSDLSSFAFYGLSSLFMTQNGFVITLYIFLNINTNRFTLFFFLNKFTKKDGQVLCKERRNDILEEVTQAKASTEPLYIKDIYDMITIGKVSVPRMINAFGQGIQGRFMNKSQCFKSTVNITLAVLYFVLLIAYGYL